MISPGFFLEILNGGAIAPELICLVLLGLYLAKEYRRRGGRSVNWFRLPPGMALVVAMFIFDFGVCVRSVTIWAWRRFFDAGDFGAMQTALLVAGGALIVVGSLCKIRALTAPDRGNGPWLVASAVSLAAIGLLIALR